MFRVARRAWLPLLVVAVVATGVFMVHRIRSYGDANAHAGTTEVYQDTKPFHPKVVIYEIFSPTGSVADVNYLDLDAQPQRRDSVNLPWSLTLSTTDPAVSPTIVAQGDSNTISCRITVDGVVKDERTSDGVHAQTFCLVKSA